MKTLLKILKYFFLVWGILTFLLAAWAGVSLFNAFTGKNVLKINHVSRHDVRFVLNGCGLGEKRLIKVVHIYESARSFTGDHFDAYAILISHVEENELTPDQYWARGDRASPVLTDAVKLVASWARNETKDWFPNENELLSENYYIYARRISMHSGNMVHIAEIAFVNPVTKMVYYASVKV